MRNKLVIKNGKRVRRRVIIIGPTRAVCVNLRTLLSVEKFETMLMLEMGQNIISLVQDEESFGIVAVTGSGKSASIIDIAEKEFGIAGGLASAIVTREHEATRESWYSDVVVVTPGIAAIWAKNGLIQKDDVIVFDEAHQASEQLWVVMALILSIGCRIIWMSATVNPEFYRAYLRSKQVILYDKIEEDKKANVKVIRPEDEGDLYERKGFLYEKIEQVILEKKGMVMFLPTRRETEAYAKAVEELFSGRIKVDFYNGGEPADKLESYLNKGTANKNRPFVIFMTNAGQSGLNIEGLSVVVIQDWCYTQKKIGRTLVRIKTFLSANDILQMIGRIYGRVSGGEGYIISARDIDFQKLRPEKVEFTLGNDLRILAMICGKLGIKHTDLSLPEPIDEKDYNRMIKHLIRRGIFMPDGIHLTEYGRKVERIPCSVEWAELIANSSPETLYAAIICSASSGIFRMLREGVDFASSFAEFIVPGSDHLTLYNIIAYAISNFAEIADSKGYTEYEFRQKEFYAWTDKKGIRAREIEEIALALKSILHNLKMPIPEKLPQADEHLRNEFVKLLARVGSLDFVRNERDIYGNEVWAERISLCEAGSAVSGTIDAWEDSYGTIRRAIGGTVIPAELCRFAV